MNPHIQKMPDVHLINNIPQTDSVNVANVFGKEHKNVLNTIKQLACSEGFSRLNFKPRDYKDERGKIQPMVEMTRDGFVFLVMGFTGRKAAAFKEAYINAFNVMELELKNRQLNLESNMAESNLALQEELLGLKDEIITMLKAQLAAVPKRIKRRPLTDDDRKEMYRLHLQGMNSVEIGKKIERSDGTVRGTLIEFRNGLLNELKAEVEQEPSVISTSAEGSL